MTIQRDANDAPWRYPLTAIAVFTLLGPAIGAIALGIMLSVALPMVAGPEQGADEFSLRASIVYMPMAYVLGGMQAFLTGAASAAYAWTQERPTPWSVPYWTSGGLALIYLIVAGMAQINVLAFLIVVAHLIAAVVCWWISRYLTSTS